MKTPPLHADPAPAALPHTHAHTPRRRGAARALPPAGLLGAGLGARLGVAALAVALLWLTVLWALN